MSRQAKRDNWPLRALWVAIQLDRARTLKRQGEPARRVNNLSPLQMRRLHARRRANPVAGTVYPILRAA